MTAAEAGTGRGRGRVYGILLALVVGLSLAAEFRSLARPDTGFLLDAAARVLDGARLYVDVVEINPPLIIAVNMPAVLSARMLGISEITAYRIGFASTLLILLALTGHLLRGLLPGRLRLRRFLLLLVAFALFPLAGQDFGEREHLVLALLIPYLLLGAGRAVGRDVRPHLAAAVGVLAGLGFALKPHFLLLWLFLEGYFRLGRRTPARNRAPETLGIGGVLAAYCAVILLVTPQYLGLVRLLAPSYTRFLYDPFLHVLVTGPGGVLVVFALLSFAALRPRARHRELWDVIALGALACLLAGAAQQKGLRYHFYPSFALATVLLGLIVRDGEPSGASRIRVVYRRLAAGVLAAVVVVVCFQNAGMASGAGQDSDRSQFQELVRVVRERAGAGEVFVMSYHLRSAYPLINYSGAASASRLPHLWILAAEYRERLQGSAPLRYRDPAEMGPSERYLNQAVLEDLSMHHPKLLVVFKHARDVPVNGLRRLDYLAYFGRDPRFAAIFKKYQLAADLGDYQVYERLAPGAARSAPPPRTEPGTRDVVRVEEGGVHLRMADPSLLVALLTFVATLAMMAVVERGPKRLHLSSD